ncbi:MAG TPA: 16S rRNA (adenine(1518)-N(6)/adenine(1519)-N(6))-dimethyltransferase RsmA [Cytophagales bacterium]|nr:16S rRNA (adenine(1518)-N(6)/adenine(1519)-N(6))-dimethyltransferase RsmA [Cytophagales bacterium]
MSAVRPKKHLGQHFLKDMSIASDIVGALTYHNNYSTLLEIGPGTGVLTDFLVKKETNLAVVEIDKESILFLEKKYPELNIIQGDFLRMDLKQTLNGTYGIIGNFPYNISSQIFFKVLEDKERVMEVVCMLQKEVAKRIASPPGNKDYGILSVFLQAYYNIEYLFTVDEHVFNPPPKVKSGVIRLKRNEIKNLDCDEKLFVRLVKQGFNNRRKTLRNALKPLNLNPELQNDELLNKRAEQLSVEDFVYLTKKAEQQI